jgi:hypothetical protein
MFLSSLALSTDSLIAAAALSGTVAPRHMAPLAVLFGVCDAGASLIGPMLGAQVPASGLPAAVILVLWGGMLMLNLPTIGRWCRSTIWAYLLPPLLAIDDLVVPGATPLVGGLVSSAMAALGFAIGYALLRTPPERTLNHRWIGAPLAAAGLLLAI